MAVPALKPGHFTISARNMRDLSFQSLANGNLCSDVYVRSFVTEHGSSPAASLLPELENPPFTIKMKKKGKKIAQDMASIASAFYPIYNFYFSSFSETNRIVTKAFECGEENGKEIERELEK